jgi:N-acylmannosamine kinase
VILALDIGGTKLAAALWDGTKLLERRETATPSNDRSPEGVTGVALELLRDVAAQGSDLKAIGVTPMRAIGVATTGSVAEGKVTALNADTLKGWNAFNLRATLEAALELPTVVLNDADAAAWGEFAFGAGRGTRDFAFVTVSTGVGGGIVLNERLHTTAHGLHAELGYTLTASGQPLELVASGSALDRWAKTQGWADAREIVRRSLEGDTAAIGKLEESARLVAQALANLYVTLGVTRVAVGGGLGLSSGYLEQVGAELVKLGEPWNALEIVRAELGVDAGLIGAADWAARGG